MKRKTHLFLFVLLTVLLSFSLVSAADSSVTVNLQSQSPDPVEPGQIVTVKFKIETGLLDTQSDVVATLLPKHPFSLYGDVAEKNLGVLPAGASGSDAIEVEYKLKVDEDAAEGDTELEFSLVFGDGGSIDYVNDEFMIDIQTHDAVLEISSITTSSESVAPGESATVEVLVKNTADSLLKDIIFSLDFDDDDLPFAPYQGSSESRIAQLESGFQQSLQFNVIALPDAAGGLYKIPLSVTYNDEKGNAYEFNDLLALQVGKQPVLRAYVKKTDIVSAGQEGKVTIGLANSDTSNINYLELEVLDSTDFVLLSPSNYFYIGDLDSDDTESEEISIYAEKGLDELVIPVKVSYSDDSNKAYQQNFDLQLTLYDSGELSKYGLVESGKGGVFFFVVLLLAGAGGYYYYRKKKKKKR